MAHTLEVSRLFTTTRQRLFDAWTNPDEMARWFFVSPDWSAEAEVDLRVGGQYRLTMITDVGSQLVQTGEYREISPPDRLVFTWNSDAVQDTLVTVEFEEVDGGTSLKLTHELLPTEELRDAHGDGWNGCLASLDAYLVSA